MSSQKPLIIPWLMSKIGDPNYPGLSWLNAEQTEFSIPWMHGRRQDRSDVDIKIFKEWAIVSGIYQPGIDEPNPKQWKRNMRSALGTKSEVQVIERHSYDFTETHKVYRIISQSSRAGQEPTEECQEPEDGISHTFDSPWLELEPDPCGRFNLSTVFQELEPLTNPLPGPEEHYAALPVQQHPMQESNPLEQFIPDNTQVESYPGLSVQQQTPQEINPLERFFPNNTLEEHFAALPVQQHPRQESNPLEQFIPDNTHVESYPGLSVQQQNPQEINPLERFFPNNTLVTDFEVNVYYRGILALNKTVQNPRGMRFTSSIATGTRPDLEDIVLPEPSIISDQEVVRMINKLLQTLVQGELLLEVQGSTIYGMRQGTCKGFWTMTEFPPVSEIKEVRKDGYTPMFTSQQFLSELIGFIRGSRKESPLYSIWLSLGDLWPDPCQKPWTKKFIMVKVTPVVFKLLHEMSFSTGASSLSSSEMNLQISDSLSSRNLLAFLQEIEEKMETEFGC